MVSCCGFNLTSELESSRTYLKAVFLKKNCPFLFYVNVFKTYSGFLSAALRAWNSCNEYMPSRIIVYRDGVGDGQLKTLVNYEVPQFLDCLKSVGRGYK